MSSSISPPLEQRAEWAETLATPMPDLSALVTEDDTPVDNLFSAKQQRLLVEPLYTSWSGSGEGRPFLVEANLFDPTGQLGAEPLRVYGLAAKEYRRLPAECLPTIGLGLRLWQVAQECQRVERLAAQLRALGMEPQEA
jgi:hypothetical protein